MKALIFREANNRPGNPDFERNRNKFWLIGNYKEGQARRDYIDIEVFGLNPFPKELFQKKNIVESADGSSWNQIIEILLTNDEFSEFYCKSMGYVGAVYVKSVEKMQKTNKNTT